METVHKKQKPWAYVTVSVVVVILGSVLGTLGMVDYYGAGVLTVFIFYFFRGRKWWCLAGQILALYWINVKMLGGLMVSNPGYSEWIGTLSTGACIAGTDSYLAVPRTAGIS